MPIVGLRPIRQNIPHARQHQEHQDAGESDGKFVVMPILPDIGKPPTIPLCEKRVSGKLRPLSERDGSDIDEGSDYAGPDHQGTDSDDAWRNDVAVAFPPVLPE
jgi:hypothetical protein